MPIGSRVPFPVAPDLPEQFEPAAAALHSGDEWERVEAGTDTAAATDTLFDVQLREAVWTGAQLVGQRFSGLVCQDVRFVQGDLAGVVFEDCRFTRVVFESCRLSGAIFAGATLQEVDVVDCLAPRADFRMAHLRRSAATGTKLQQADFYGCRLTDVRLSACDVSGADFETSVVERLDLRGSTVDGVRGVAALGGSRIDSDQVLPLGAALMGSLGFHID